jgi:hypothetical protein
MATKEKKKSKKADDAVGAVGEATDLAVVGDADDSKEYANKEIRDKILSLLSQSEDLNWDLAIVLETAYAGDMYRGWGFDSFRSYVEEELQIHIRKAQYLVQLQEWFKKMPGNIQAWVRGLGWTKARMLMHVVTAENAAEWRNRVAGKSAADIAKMLKEAKASESTEGSDGDGEANDKPKKKSFSLFDLQYENVERAIEKAAEMSGSDKEGHNLDLICTEFLGTHAGIDSPPEFLQKIEKDLGLRLVAYDEENDSIAYGSDLVEELERRDADDEDDGDENAEYAN